MTTLDHDSILWLAGLAEGEATFDLQRGKYPRIRFGMVDRDVVGRVATLFGSSIRCRLKMGAQPLFTAEIQGQRAVEIMEALLPHMGARRSGKIAAILTQYRSQGSPTYAAALGIDLYRPPGILSPA